MRIRKTQMFGAVTVLALVFAAIAAQAQLPYSFGSAVGDPLRPTSPGIIAQGRDGNMYSTTPLGGASNCGAIFKITTAGILSVLWSSDCTENGGGAAPFSGLTLGTDGNFYGTTSDICFGFFCTPAGYGTVFKFSPSSGLTTLHRFDNLDGDSPETPPVQGTDGNFYGTTNQGGTDDDGTVYKITPSGVFTSLYSFDFTHGAGPSAPLILGADGNFYGITSGGGTGTCVCGTVFKITTKGKLTTLYSFDGILAENPASPLVQGNSGSFFGTTVGDTSATSCANGACGTAFKITSQGTLTVLHSFAGTDGASPYAGLALASDGNLYGVTSRGPFGLAVLYRVSPEGDFSELGLLAGVNAAPAVTMLQHTNGILYGETQLGGAALDGEFYSLNQSLKTFAALVPNAGKVGKTVGILGHGLEQTATVSFNGTAAKFTVKSNTFLEATVPAGAITGKVTVTRPSGKLVSKQNFQVMP